MPDYYETSNGAREYALTHSSIPDFYGEDIQRLAGFLAPTAGKNILELGIGAGRDAKLLLQMLGCSYTGIDISYPMIDQARQYNAGKSLNLSVQNLLHLGLPNSTFDAIWAAAVFHHISSQQLQFRNGLVEAHRILRPAGVFFISARTGGDFEEINSKTGLTYYHRSAGTLTKELDEAGFNMLEYSQINIPFEGKPISYLKMFAQKSS